MKTILQVRLWQRFILTVMLGMGFFLITLTLLNTTISANRHRQINPDPPNGYNDKKEFGRVGFNGQFQPASNGVRANPASKTSIAATTQITLSAYSGFFSQFSKNGIIFCYKLGGGSGGRGLNFGVINQETGAIEDCQNFDTWANKQAFLTMTHFISDAIPPGRIVLVAIADEAGFIQNPLSGTNCHTPSSDPRVEKGYQALESLGSTQIRNVGYWGSWTIIAISRRDFICYRCVCRLLFCRLVSQPRQSYRTLWRFWFPPVQWNVRENKGGIAELLPHKLQATNFCDLDSGARPSSIDYRTQ